MPEVRHGKLEMKELGDVLEETRSRGSEDDVVDIQQKVVRKLVAAPKDEQRGITKRRDEAKAMSVVGETLVPLAARDEARGADGAGAAAGEIEGTNELASDAGDEGESAGTGELATDVGDARPGEPGAGERTQAGEPGSTVGACARMGELQEHAKQAGLLREGTCIMGWCATKSRRKSSESAEGLGLALANGNLVSSNIT